MSFFKRFIKQIIIVIIVLIIVCLIYIFRNHIISFVFPSPGLLKNESDQNGISIEELLNIKHFPIKIFTGVAALIAIVLALQRTRNETKKLENQKENLDFERNKFKTQNLNDRYSKAVELLGSDKLMVRIGAIYTLKTLVDEDKAYYTAFIDILKGYIKSELLSKRILDEKKVWHESYLQWSNSKKKPELILDLSDYFATRPYRKLPKDIEIALNFLSTKHGNELVDLKNTDWEGIDFTDTELLAFRNINFDNAKFNFTYFALNQEFNKCGMQNISLKEIFMHNVLFTESYRNENNNYKLFSCHISDSYLGSLHFTSPFAYSLVKNSAIITSTFLNDKKNNFKLPLTEILFEDVYIVQSHFNKSFKNVFFNKCTFSDTEIIKQGIIFNTIFFIDCEFLSYGFSGSLFKRFNHSDFPRIPEEMNQNINKVFMDKRSFQKCDLSKEKFQLFPIQINKDFSRVTGVRKDFMKDFINVLCNRNDIGLILRKE